MMAMAPIPGGVAKAIMVSLVSIVQKYYFAGCCEWQHKECFPLAFLDAVTIFPLLLLLALRTKDIMNRFLIFFFLFACFFGTTYAQEPSTKRVGTPEEVSAEFKEVQKKVKKAEKKAKKEAKKGEEKEELGKLKKALAAQRKDVKKEEKKLAKLKANLQNGKQKGTLSPVDVEKMEKKILKQENRLGQQQVKLKKLERKI
jgi:hypothetical protein